MNRESITSSNLASAGFDPATQTIEIEFNSGAVWQYPGSQEDFDGLMIAESAGRYFAQVIKPRGGRQVS